MEISSDLSIPLPLADELAAVARCFYQRGWAPATSTNYSTLISRESSNFKEMKVIITRSGIDKAFCQGADMLLVDGEGKCLPSLEGNLNKKPSAETPLHMALYRFSNEIGAVVHSHSVASTILSRMKAHEKKITFSGYEMLKGLSGVETHESSQFIPIFGNTQDMFSLGKEVTDYLINQNKDKSENKKILGVLIEGHGLYAWGENISSAKRHAEVYEFLFECILTAKGAIL